MISWYDGEGNPVSEEIIFEQISIHTKKKGKVFIGTDSMLKSDSCVFASAICLHGALGQRGGRYFFNKKKTGKKNLGVLRLRIMQEVQNSIDLGLRILERDPKVDIEIHIDIGSTHRSKTRDLVDMMQGWTKSIGFKCKVKPHAWASASVADKHTK
jgi:uncharacterized protein